MENGNLEYSACPLCHGERRSPVLYRFDPYAIVRCDDCGLAYLHPRLRESEMLSVYESNTYFRGDESGYSEYAAQEQALRATFRRLLSNLRRRQPVGPALLDIGCGYGYLLAEAAPFFPVRVGLEFSPEAADAAEQHATEVVRGGIEHLRESDVFDCVTCNHVIEHVYEPVEFLRAVRAHMKPGATLVLSTPWMNGPLYRVMRRRWPSFKTPEHVSYYDEARLRILLDRAGFSHAKKLPYPHAFPVSVVLSKFKLRVGGILGRQNLWVPGTTIALTARA